MIYLIITTCINIKFGLHNNKHRENRYIECIEQLLKLLNNDPTIKPIIVENNGLRDTYLDNFDCDILYTNNNIPYYSHKAGNELLDIKEVIDKYKINDEDYVIKLTGRYKLLNLDFINTIKSNNYDAFIKFFNVCTKEYLDNDCVLGLFAIKSKYLKNFNYKLKKSAECEFAEYVRKNTNNIMEIKQLNLECCFADSLDLLVV